MQSDDADKRRTPKKTAAKKAAPKKAATKSKKADTVEKKEEVPVIVIPVQEEIKQDPLPDLVIQYEPLPPQEQEVIEEPIKEETEVIDKPYNTPKDTGKDVFTKVVVPLIGLLVLSTGSWYFANKISMQKARQQPEQSLVVDSTAMGGKIPEDTTLSNEQINAIVATLAEKKVDSIRKSEKKITKENKPKKIVYEKATTTDNIDTVRKYMQILLSDYKRLTEE